MHQTHIFQEFDTAIANLKTQLQTMANLTKQNLERAVQALLSHDIDLSRTVIGEDTEVDELEMKVDHLGMEILLRFHPVASDLRFVITSMKAAHNLERISDHAVNIAKRAKKICKSENPIDSTIIEPLFTMANSLLHDAWRSYTEDSSAIGEHLHANDAELDKAHKQVIAQLSSQLETSGSNAENILHLIFVSRSLERIGDLAVNIGEDSVFMKEARDIRHQNGVSPVI